MRKTIFLLFLLLAASITVAAAFTKNTIGNTGEFDYELWKNSANDNAGMTLTGGGTFEGFWADNAHALFRMGKKLGSTKTYAEYGDITVDYAAEHNIIKGDVSYLCVYGWTTNPLIEFYVVENYGNYKPPGGKGYKGTVELDGGTYEVYTDTRVNEPSIQGNQTFEQYFSVRTDKRTEGVISVSEHFKAWEEMGLDMSGVVYEVALCVEGYRGAGDAKITRHILTLGDTVYGTGAPPVAPETVSGTENQTPFKPDEISETTADAASTAAGVNPKTGESPVSSGFAVIVLIASVLAIVILLIFLRKWLDGWVEFPEIIDVKRDKL